MRGILHACQSLPRASSDQFDQKRIRVHCPVEEQNLFLLLFFTCVHLSPESKVFSNCKRKCPLGLPKVALFLFSNIMDIYNVIRNDDISGRYCRWQLIVLCFLSRWPAMCIHGDKSQQERDWVLSGECLRNPVTSWICNMKTCQALRWY